MSNVKILFDDCEKLIKQACYYFALKSKIRVSNDNLIHFYVFYGDIMKYIPNIVSSAGIL